MVPMFLRRRIYVILLLCFSCQKPPPSPWVLSQLSAPDSSQASERLVFTHKDPFRGLRVILWKGVYGKKVMVEFLGTPIEGEQVRLRWSTDEEGERVTDTFLLEGGQKVVLNKEDARAIMALLQKGNSLSLTVPRTHYRATLPPFPARFAKRFSQPLPSL